MRDASHKALRAALLFQIGLATWCLPAPLSAHPGSGIAVDRLGQVYFVDTGSGLWKVDTRGRLVRIATQRYHWLALDQDDLFHAARLPTGAAGDVVRVGEAPTLLIASDYPLTISRDGNLYYPARRADGAALDLTRLEPGGGHAVLASIPLPYLNGLAAAPDGSLYFTSDRTISRVELGGTVTTIVARVAPPQCPPIPGNDPNDPQLRGLAVDSTGTIFVAASGCGSVLKVTPDGRVSTVLQLEGPWAPTAVALYRGNIFVLEYLHTEVEDRLQWIPRVRRISPDGTGIIIATVTR